MLQMICCARHLPTRHVKSGAHSAGVPVKRAVAGVAMGLILEPSGDFQILTDILGSEDAMGDMDFKVAGDADNITAFQMDIKVGILASISSCSTCSISGQPLAKSMTYACAPV